MQIVRFFTKILEKKLYWKFTKLKMPKKAVMALSLLSDTKIIGTVFPCRMGLWSQTFPPLSSSPYTTLMNWNSFLEITLLMPKVGLCIHLRKPIMFTTCVYLQTILMASLCIFGSRKNSSVADPWIT